VSERHECVDGRLIYFDRTRDHALAEK